MSQEQDKAAQGGGFAHAFHETTVAAIEASARRYIHRPIRAKIAAARPHSGPGARIRAKIAANAARRVEIAAAMKREAGVEVHELIGERDGGLASNDRRHIVAPEGENRQQLRTLAHECGHIFLHALGTPGCHLSGHVKEMEAECYAHQAFRVHGMDMPRHFSASGRRYVGQWIEADRKAGVAIDPRAEAYVKGWYSPREPLRKIPASWKQAGLVADDAAEVELARRFPQREPLPVLVRKILTSTRPARMELARIGPPAVEDGRWEIRMIGHTMAWLPPYMVLKKFIPGAEFALAAFWLVAITAVVQIDKATSRRRIARVGSEASIAAADEALAQRIETAEAVGDPEAHRAAYAEFRRIVNPVLKL